MSILCAFTPSLFVLVFIHYWKMEDAFFVTSLLSLDFRCQSTSIGILIFQEKSPQACSILCFGILIIGKRMQHPLKLLHTTGGLSHFIQSLCQNHILFLGIMLKKLFHHHGILWHWEGILFDYFYYSFFLLSVAIIRYLFRHFVWKWPKLFFSLKPNNVFMIGNY